MRLILTHEQADMDALASLLGAHLLDPESFPLLPRQINRNGLNFIRRYAADLNFCTIKELPAEAIDEILLVDTQSLVTLKGMSSATNVRVIDHHPRKANSSPEWQVELHQTGACTTVLVEKLKAAGVQFSNTQANLLLLGIYEDTGSLSYASTTTRDLLAAAFLLEHGADLNTISHYLNPPLSHAQMQLYDRLLRDISTHVVENNTILIARASALDVHDEISSVAHKIREFLDPDGLILLVATKQGLRLVARATTDEIDMSQLAHFFGGGGHKRAASALIHTEGRSKSNDSPHQWASIYQQVVSMLPEIVHPATRVRQIMSSRPLVLDPDTPVDTVADLMKRYGFEGYPVVENGKIVGLLTRRSVDRALSHKLSSNASILMDAGTVSVYPQDTLDHLQQVMASSGWGQVPVVDPQSGEIVGIVTRTDLIGSRNGISHAPGQEEMVKLLQNAIPYPRQALLQTLAKEAGQLGFQAYIVGGFVRDLLLGQPSLDFDIVIEGNAIAFVEHLVQKFGGRAVSHRRFGTAKWVFAKDREELARKISPDHPIDPQALPEHLDLITARTEFYEKPAALPTVESSSIKMDLHRRDFSINTMAIRLDGVYFGKLFDYWGGYHDLQEGTIRVLHALSFVDDATRILRGIRFAARFGFKFEPRSLSLLESSLPLLEELSGARLRHELDLMLAESKVSTSLMYLERLNVLAAIHPKLAWNAAIEARMAYLNNPICQAEWKLESKQDALSLRQVIGYCYWLEDLSPGDLGLVAARLRMPAWLEQLIRQTAKLRRDLPALVGAPASLVVKTLEASNPIVITAVCQSSPDAGERAVLQAYMREYRQIKPHTSGHDLRARGIPPSPRYQEILSALRAAWLDGEIHSEAEELSFLEHLLNEE